MQTILIGTCVQIQGVLVRTLENGRVVISTGEQLFEGQPVGRLTGKNEQKLRQ